MNNCEKCGSNENITDNLEVPWWDFLCKKCRNPEVKMIEMNVKINVPDELSKVVSRIINNYTGIIPFRFIKFTNKYIIQMHIINKDAFDGFLHTEFIKLIPVLEVKEDNLVTTLSWPEENHNELLKTIEILETKPEI